MTPEPGATTRIFAGKDRLGVTLKIEFDDEVHGGVVEGYVTGNRAPDGSLKEVFLHGFGKDGSTMRGWTDFAAILLSMALQSGADFSAIIRRVTEMKFEPYGKTRHPEIPYAPSVPAFVVCWLALRFGTEKDKAAVADAMKEWSE